MKVEWVHGDLIQMAKKGQVKYIGHGCNCFHAMGAGIAPKIADAFPGVREADKASVWGDINKMGTVSVAECDDLTVFNMYTQYTTSTHGGVDIHWESLTRCLLNAMDQIPDGETLAIPLIGCGLAGGSLESFEQVITNFEQILTIVDKTLMVVRYGPI